MVRWIGRAGGEGSWLPADCWDSALSFSIAAVAIWILIFARGLLGIRKTPVLVPRPVSDAPVTAIVPARDEAQVIERSLRALLAEPVRKIIAVDDRSSDGTGDILRGFRDPRLAVIADPPGPRAGECGKPAALVFALEASPASTEWLMFVDADVVLAPGAVGALLEAGAGADLVSVIPRVEMTSFIEALLMPSIGALVLAANPPHLVADPSSRAAFANGQVVLVRRAIYEKIGGHRAVIGEILEDVRLAERVKRGGGRLVIADGRFIASTHMYAGWSELREGWSKNLYLLTGGTKASTIRWILLTSTLAWLGPLAAVIDFPRGFAAWAAIAVMQAVLRKLGGASMSWAPLAPLSAILTAYLLARSARLHLRKQPIAWKGRAY